MKKKLLALILAATMAFPVCAFADDAEEETATEAVAEEETEHGECKRLCFSDAAGRRHHLCNRSDQL